MERQNRQGPVPNVSNVTTLGKKLIGFLPSLWSQLLRHLLVKRKARVENNIFRIHHMRTEGLRWRTKINIQLICDSSLSSLLPPQIRRLTPEQAFEPKASDQKKPGLFTIIGWGETGLISEFFRRLIHKDIVGRSDQVATESWHGHSIVDGTLPQVTSCPISFWFLIRHDQSGDDYFLR